MAALSSLLAYLGTKGVAAAGAATLMVGGGVAVAQTGGLDLAQDRVPDEVELPVVDDQDEMPEGDIERETETETEVEEISQNDPINTLEIEECPTEDPECEPEPVDCDTDPEACPEPIEDECEDDITLEGETEEQTTDEETSTDLDCRSETAKRVHEALTGGALDEAGEPIVPGHPEFGATVSERARDKDVHLGREVSEAARGGDTEPEDGETEELTTQDTTADTEDEGAGKPAWAGQPGGPNGRPQR